MNRVMKALNPTSTIATVAEATAMARASAVAIFLGVAWGLFGLALMTTSGQAGLEAAIAEAVVEVPEMAGMSDILVQLVLWISLAVITVQLALGIFQWLRPGIVVPIVFLILTGWGLLGALLAAVGISDGGPDFTGWPAWVGLGLLIVQSLLHFSGVRGARKLEQTRATADA